MLGFSDLSLLLFPLVSCSSTLPVCFRGSPPLSSPFRSFPLSFKLIPAALSSALPAFLLSSVPLLSAPLLSLLSLFCPSSSFPVPLSVSQLLCLFCPDPPVFMCVFCPSVCPTSSSHALVNCLFLSFSACLMSVYLILYSVSPCALINARLSLIPATVSCFSSAVHDITMPRHTDCLTCKPGVTV